MGTWSWASVASRSLPSTKVGSHLSICPNDVLAGQVDRSPPYLYAAKHSRDDLVVDGGTHYC